MIQILLLPFLLTITLGALLFDEPRGTLHVKGKARWTWLVGSE